MTYSIAISQMLQFCSNAYRSMQNCFAIIRLGFIGYRKYLVAIIIVLLQLICVPAEKCIAAPLKHNLYRNGHDLWQGIAPKNNLRRDTFKFIKPQTVPLKQPDAESAQYAELKKSIENQIYMLIYNGRILDCSFFLRNLKNQSYTVIHPDVQYDPASILKIIVMIAVLHKAESTPGFLDKKETFTSMLKTARVTYYTGKQIQLGESYTIRELLKYMIAYSDNEATSLLIEEIGLPDILKVHYDLGVPAAENGIRPLATAAQVSILLNVLYNASYLNAHNSEFACSLLAQSDFAKGIAAGVPAGTTLIHKYGEGGGIDMGNLQLHETAIIYLPDGPVEMTILTKGVNVEYQAQAIAAITQTAYNMLVKK